MLENMTLGGLKSETQDPRIGGGGEGNRGEEKKKKLEAETMQGEGVDLSLS